MKSRSYVEYTHNANVAKVYSDRSCQRDGRGQRARARSADVDFAFIYLPNAHYRYSL